MIVTNIISHGEQWVFGECSRHLKSQVLRFLDKTEFEIRLPVCVPDDMFGSFSELSLTFVLSQVLSLHTDQKNQACFTMSRVTKEAN